MGTIAARDCLRVLELTEQVAAALLIAVRQGMWLRMNLGCSLPVPPRLSASLVALARDVAPIVDDRRLDLDLQRVLRKLRMQEWAEDGEGLSDELD